MPPPTSFSEPSAPQPKPIPSYMNVMIFSILIVGFDTGLRMAVKLTESEREKDQLEKENMETQLTMLKNQVSPHFFMNTLNNIHSLIDISTSEAKEAVIRLSNLMRYLLYETASDKTSLKDEMDFITSYIDLMRLRFTENVEITLNLPERIPDKRVSPFLFTAFIENAFKHGISYKTKSYIVVDIAADENRLLLKVKNSIPTEVTQNTPSGIGVENTRKRLDLLYGQNYHLDILNDGNEFNVTLSLPL
jgi:LytS/YehU family sensor histidine kinase